MTTKVNKLVLPQSRSNQAVSWGELTRTLEQWSEQVRLRLVELESQVETSALRQLVSTVLIPGTSIAITTIGAGTSLTLTIAVSA